MQEPSGQLGPGRALSIHIPEWRDGSVLLMFWKVVGQGSNIFVMLSATLNIRVVGLRS